MAKTTRTMVMAKTNGNKDNDNALDGRNIDGSGGKSVNANGKYNDAADQNSVNGININGNTDHNNFNNSSSNDNTTSTATPTPTTPAIIQWARRTHPSKANTNKLYNQSTTAEGTRPDRTTNRYRRKSTGPCNKGRQNQYGEDQPHGCGGAQSNAIRPCSIGTGVI